MEQVAVSCLEEYDEQIVLLADRLTYVASERKEEGWHERERGHNWLS